MFPVLETPRLRLRETTLGDAQAVLQVFSDDEVTRYYNVDTMTALTQAEALIRRRAEAYAAGMGIRWALELKETGEYVGSCGLPFTLHMWRVAEVGYELAREQWGRGLMPEAVLAVCHHAFHAMSLQRVEAQVMPANTASIKVLEKCGFQREGLLRRRGFWKGEEHDLLMYGLLAADSRQPPEEGTRR